jgi:hypothetical protein
VGLFDRKIRCVAQAGWGRSVTARYNTYYAAKVPFIVYDEVGASLHGKDLVDWAEMPDCEFTCDFSRPLRMRFGLSPFRPEWELNLSLQRSRDLPSFGEQDCAVLDIVNGHMQNYLRLFDRCEPVERPGLAEMGSGVVVERTRNDSP